jgi:hypothetical protein
MKNTINFLLLLAIIISCSGGDQKVEFPHEVEITKAQPIHMKRSEAIRLMGAFYGCFDWHSAVHGHWSLMRVVNLYPGLDDEQQIVDKLLSHITEENIRMEVAYFNNELSQGFERMYGWAWLLKLAEEIHVSDHPKAKILEQNLQPLTNLIVEKVFEFLPKLKYPIRVGTHTNTAFAMSLIHDYASSLKNIDLLNAIEARAKEYYKTDADCPLSWEPSGYDFLSPCLEEAYLMSKVMSADEYERWISDFLPELQNEEFSIEPGEVTDRTDGHLVHLDGLNFSRAWCLYGIAKALPKYDHLIAVANSHIEHSLPNITDGNYEGGHWLASFALLSMPYE